MSLAAPAPRAPAPLGRRALEVLAVERHGAYGVLRLADPAGPRPVPGQFYMLALAAGWGGGADERPFVPRALSYLRARGEGKALALDFMLEDVGPGTHALLAAEPGGAVAALGPLGNGFAPAPAGLAVLVGGGVGVAPVAALGDALRAADAPRATLLGFRDAHHAAGAALLPEPPQVATDDGSVGHAGRVTKLLERLLDARAAERPAVYACGPPPMLEAVRALCGERGVAAQLALESGMACGYGACFGCVVATRDGYVRLCVDGPVLAAADLEAVR